MVKKILYFALFLLVAFLVVAGIYYQKIYGNAIQNREEIFVHTNSSMEDLHKSLEGIVNIDNFNFVADLKSFTNPRAGKYILTKGMNMNAVVNELRSGNHPIKITFNNQDTLEKLAGRISQQIEADSISILNEFKEISFLKENNFTEKSALGMYIPNQYEVYWNISPKKFKTKMLHAYNKFWTAKRIKKAKELNLNKNQVITLASIVQKETAQNKERPTVAGLYLNRYTNGWPLQADPTVIFAIKEQKGHSTVIKRVLNKDLSINSPYNTYKNKGLPPSLISMPDISSIDAVLNADNHNYYYMCASTTNIGFHEFAKTLAQHNRNAKKYQNWINQRGIRR